MKTLLPLAGAIAMTGLLLSEAASVNPVSYDMPNGHGQAVGGSYNYWDKNYSGSGATTSDNAHLSGGLGDLTDGVIAPDNWFNVENSAGTGPYVGWNWRFPTPTIDFHFGGLTHIDSMTIYVDDPNGAGGVTVPASIDIAADSGPALTYLLADAAGSAPTAYTFGGLNLDLTTLSLRLNHRTEWVFLSEVTFEGGPARVPDAGHSGVLLAAGLLGLAEVSRRWSVSRKSVS